MYYYVEDAEEMIAHISKIVIEPEHRHKGIGKATIIRLEMLLKSLEFKLVSLNVFAPNKVATG